MIKNKENSDHYFWGKKCEGFQLLKSEELSIIQEIMPPKTSEILHYHNNSQQFFYILKGKATFEINGKKMMVEKESGILIKPKQRHKIYNNEASNLEFLVISQPTTKNDRINI